MKDFRKLFGSNLRTCRECRNQTLQQVCDLLGGTIGVSTLSRYELGECLPPTMEAVQQLAEAMGCLPSETRRLKILFLLAVNCRFGTVDLLLCVKEFAL